MNQILEIIIFVDSRLVTLHTDFGHNSPGRWPVTQPNLHLLRIVQVRAGEQSLKPEIFSLSFRFWLSLSAIPDILGNEYLMFLFQKSEEG